MKIKSVIENNDTKAGRLFDFFIQLLILISLASFTIETLPDLSIEFRQILSVIEIICVIIFSIEYLLRIYVADNKLKFIFSFYGLVDLLAILPFYVAQGIDLRSIRIFRLFRLFRAFKILRYSKALQRFKNAFLSVKEELVIFLIATLFLLYIASVGIYYFEVEAQPDQFSSIFHCLWWAVATMTTVGYGDIYPITVGGKIFSSIVILLGVGIVAIPTGLIASAFTKISNKEE